MSGRRHSRLSRRRSRGATVIDYLMITAVVAGVVFPLMWKFFGGPMNDTLQGQRSRLVNFIGQKPKRTVPNMWFGRGERMGDPGNPKNLDGPKDINAPKDLNAPQDLGTVGDVGGNGNLNGPRDLKNPGDLKTVGNVGGNGQLGAVGNPGGIAGFNGGGAGAGAGGAGAAGAGGGGNLDGQFFGGKAGDGKSALDDVGDSGANGKGTFANGKGGGGGSSGGGEGDAEPDKKDGKKAKAGDDGGSGEKAKTMGEQKRKDLAGLAKAEEDERRRHDPFDWMRIMKFLIILLIIFLLILIALSNLKRAR